MSAVSSSTGLCNLAFDLLRHKETVSNLDTPDNASEDLAARWYDTTRRAVLGAYAWNFARKRDALALNATAPAFGYDNAYNLPNDFLGIVFVGDNYTDQYITDFIIESGQILTNNNDGATLNICYISDFTSVVRFDPLFIDLLVLELAIRFSRAIVGFNKSIKDLTDMRKEAKAAARSKNGFDNPMRRREVSKVLTKRKQVTRGNTTDGVHLFS